MTPSNGTSSPPTKTVWSLAKGAEEEEEAVELDEVEEEEGLVAAEPEEVLLRPPSALVSVRL